MAASFSGAVLCRIVVAVLIVSTLYSSNGTYCMPNDQNHQTVFKVFLYACYAATLDRSTIRTNRGFIVIDFCVVLQRRRSTIAMARAMTARTATAGASAMGTPRAGSASQRAAPASSAAARDERNWMHIFANK